MNTAKFPPPHTRLSVEFFESCDEVQTHFRKQLEIRQAIASALPVALDFSNSAGPQPSLAAEASSESYTNVQEQGVDEADHTKIAKDHIFVARNKQLEVVDRSTLTLLGSVSLDGLTLPRLYTDEERLIIIGRKVGSPITSYDLYLPYSNDSEVRIYSTEKGQLPQLLETRKLSGPIEHSRLVNNNLILIFTDYMPVDQASAHDPKIPVPEKPVEQTDSNTIKKINCQQITRPAVEDFDYRFTRVVSMDIQNLSRPLKSVGITGGGDTIYMTKENLYLSKYGIQWFSNNFWQNPNGTSWIDIQEQLVLTKVRFQSDSGNLTVEAAGAISGYVKDQWAFKEYADKDVLAVATTTNFSQTGGRENHLWLLKQEGKGLKVVAGVYGFGKTENIRAVRYVDEIAYVVTFRQIDPLFAFDLSDPLQPKQLSELKIPGFSTYLHPVTPDRLVGVGLEFQAVQISLFDTSDPTDVSRVDNHILGIRGSYSDVNSDHHAFYHDPSNNIVGIPLVALGEEVFSGAVFYRVEDKILKEAKRLSHSEMIPPEYLGQLYQWHWWQSDTKSLDINRIFKVDGRLITVSPFGIKAFDPVDFIQIQPALIFP